MDKEFLYDMLRTPSVSGHEIALQKKVIQHMEPVADEILTDATGDVISVLNPHAEAKVLLCGHIDEIGFLVTRICEDGMLKVTKAGGIHPVLYLGTHVQVVCASQILPGVVVTNRTLESKEQVQVEDLFIDLGFDSKAECERYVSIGDPVCAASEFTELAHGKLAGRALDDRIGAFIILEALKKAKQKQAACGIYAATTCGEETTMRGAYHVATRVQPSCALIVDVTFASDYPGVSGDASGTVKLGGGAVLCSNSMINKPLNAALAAIAEEHQLDVQWEVFAGKAGTDGDVVHFTNGGVPVALISIPLRYMHSSIETASYQDLETIIELISKFLVRFDDSFSFDPFP